MHYFVTGHTGFKGSWLVLMLRSQGHRVSGLSLDPPSDSLFARAEVAQDLEFDYRADIRDPAHMSRALAESCPDVLIHMAAQPLVRASYLNPRETFETNVMGTLAVLEGVTQCPSIRAQVIVTTDKVYRNINQSEGYLESDPLGGDDPYSASKAMADILTSSWAHSFSGPPTVIARAGNVIGGGDVATDRLMPDIMHALINKRPVSLRYPNSVRPWQHVLDCLAGYKQLLEATVAGEASGAWNFGPDSDSMQSVARVTELATDMWGSTTPWTSPPEEHPQEAALLTLNAAHARAGLGWAPKLDLTESIRWTVDWYRAVESGMHPRTATLDQIEAFMRMMSPGT